MKQHLRPPGDRKELVFYLLWNHLFLPSGIIGWIKVDRVWVRNCGMICLGVPRTDLMLPSHWFTSPSLASDWLRAPELAALGIQGPWLLVSSCHLWTLRTLLAGTPAPSWPGAQLTLSTHQKKSEKGETSKANKQDRVFILSFVCPTK